MVGDPVPRLTFPNRVSNQRCPRLLVLGFIEMGNCTALPGRTLPSETAQDSRRPFGKAAVEYMASQGFNLSATADNSIGTGGYGHIYKARMGSTPVACKVLVLNDIFTYDPEYVRHMLPRELDILQQELRHPNIIAVFSVFRPPFWRSTTDKVYIFMELLAMSLLELITDRRWLPEEEAKSLFKQIAAGVEYLHSKNWAHRDIKSANVLLNASATVAKITDFGLSKRVRKKERSRTFMGSEGFQAPQIDDKVPYDPFLADVYGLGATLFHMLEGEVVVDQNYLFVGTESQACKEFTLWLLSEDEDHRPTVSEALKHRWITGQTIALVRGVPALTDSPGPAARHSQGAHFAPFTEARGSRRQSRASAMGLSIRLGELGGSPRQGDDDLEDSVEID